MPSDEWRKAAEQAGTGRAEEVQGSSLTCLAVIQL